MSFTLQDISDNIVPVHDFPKQGIMFRDVTNLLLNNELFNFTIDKMAEIVNLSGLKPDYIAGLESRGFLFRELANRLKCGFVMIRKPNKLFMEINKVNLQKYSGKLKFSSELPNSISIDYEKEYGTDSLTITNSISEGSKILLVDDLMATGGTMNAGRKLIELIKCIPVCCINLIELSGLPINEELLESKIPILSLLKYNFDDPSVILNKTLNCVLTIKDYVPLITSNESNQTIVFCHPSIETLSDNYIANHPWSRKGTIIWDKFPDTQPNITFENMDQLENNKIVFFLSLYDTGLLFQQLSMLMVLPRQFIDTLDIYIAYFSVGTMERVDKEGMLATAETMAKIISSCIETTKNGKATIHIWDIHALPIRFYFNTNNVLVSKSISNCINNK